MDWFSTIAPSPGTLWLTVPNEWGTYRLLVPREHLLDFGLNPQGQSRRTKGGQMKPIMGGHGISKDLGQPSTREQLCIMLLGEPDLSETIARSKRQKGQFNK
jgi:hypothetical protein